VEKIVSTVIAPFGSATVEIAKNESIAIFTQGSASVSRIISAPNYPSQTVSIGRVANEERIFGPYADGATIIIGALENVEVLYQTGVEPFVQPEPFITPLVSVAGTSYTVPPSDWGKQIQTSNSSAVTITFDASSLVGVSPGDVVAITQGGAGTVSVTGAGVTVRTTAVYAQYATAGFQLKANGEVWGI
jgi:hypothetical protein